MKIERPANFASSADTLHALTCHVPCKVNLFLEVLGKRADGYHNLDTLMLAVDLYDSLTVRPRSDAEISFRIDFSSDPLRPVAPRRFSQDDPAWEIPSDERNLVVRALRRLQSELGVAHGIDARLVKRIPAQAGLGGGSADAAAALVLGSLVWSKRLNQNRIRRIAAELGSDLNFFLEGWMAGRWTAYCTGRGEQIAPVANNADQHLVIIHPPQGCNTAEIFHNLTGQFPQSSQSTPVSPRNSSEMLEAIALGRNDRVAALLYNRLEAVARRSNPWIDRMAKWFDRYKPLGHCLSGSGSARFCLCSDRREAEKIASELASLSEFRVFVASTWHSPSIQEQALRLGFEE